jgi:NAD+ kinase
MRVLLATDRTVIKTRIKSVMIVTKARDHSLVQLTRDLALWLMTTPRYGDSYGVIVHVDGKLQRSKRFDAEELCTSHEIIREKNLLRYWTQESCAYADTYDIVITVCTRPASLTVARWRRHRALHIVALSANCPTHHLV